MTIFSFDLICNILQSKFNAMHKLEKSSKA